MRRVHAAGITGNSREQRELVDIGRGAGRIEHAGAQPRRARVQAFAQELGHPGLFGRRGATIRIVHRRHPQRRVADQCRDVDRGPRRADRCDIGCHGRIDVFVAAAQQVEWRRHVAMHQRCQADAAIADDDRGDALTDLRQHLRRGQYDLIVVRMHVDEARCHDFPGDVLHISVLRRQMRADRGDALAFDAHIGDEARSAGAVDDRAATQNERAMACVAHHPCTSPLDHAHCRTGWVSLSTPRSRSTCCTRFN